MTYACKSTLLTSPRRKTNFGAANFQGKAPVYKINHARILLKADINSTQGEWTDQAISQALDISPATIERVRRFVEQGMEAALNRQVQQNANPDGEQEAHLLAMLCGPTPEGQGRWTLRLLAEKEWSWVMWRAFPMKQ